MEGSTIQETDKEKLKILSMGADFIGCFQLFFYELGILSKKTRNIRIVNTLTSQEHTIEICGEETLNQILERYLPYNKHAGSYTWKYDSKGLDMTGTLEDNGIVDDEEDLDALCIDPEQWTPAIHLYFNDDLTEA